MEHHYEHFWLDPKFWVAVSFIIFLLLVGRRIWTALTDALDARAERVRAELAEAVARAQAEAAQRSEELNARLNAQIEQAERRIAAARDSAMGALRQVSTDTAEALVSRLVGGAADRAAIERAVDGELAARGRA